jgi:DNA polymerase beta
MDDKRFQIAEIFELLLTEVQKNKDETTLFKIRAYENAFKVMEEYGPIYTVEDINALNGIGKKLRAKMIEIVETGNLQEAQHLRKAEKIRNDLLNIYGIGPSKADDLIEKYNIQSLEDLIRLLQKDRSILTAAQTLGLIYYEDLQQRIPREEMVVYDTLLYKFFEKYAPEFSMTTVGSYRRGGTSSGDIDILLTYKNLTFKEASDKFQSLIQQLTESEYIVGSLAQGKNKFLGIIQLPPLLQDNSSGVSFFAHRIDILLTPPEQIACALLYFTGSKEFNIEFRKYAIHRGYTLSEKGMKKLNKELPIPDPPSFQTEKDVFDFLGIIYQEPSERKGPIQIIE